MVGHVVASVVEREIQYIMDGGGDEVAGNPVTLKEEEVFDLDERYRAMKGKRKVALSFLENRLDSIGNIVNDDFEGNGSMAHQRMQQVHQDGRTRYPTVVIIFESVGGAHNGQSCCEDRVYSCKMVDLADQEVSLVEGFFFLEKTTYLIRARVTARVLKLEINLVHPLYKANQQLTEYALHNIEMSHAPSYNYNERKPKAENQLY
ncbi:hypothetical protein VNO77_44018 [Canavalia gladiata]|uniref:Uncharacterized protein n=1 Tax=Canavalia gladiata TaxID=3824 RepID=A0AAN9JW41_CANGL